MHQYPSLELKYSFARVTVRLVLVLGVLGILTTEWVLEFRVAMGMPFRLRTRSIEFSFFVL